MKTAKSAEEIIENIKNEDMLMLYFGSNTCGICTAMKPKLEKLLGKYPKIKSLRVETENSPELSASYNVFTIPVIILYIHGKETIREARIISLVNLEQKISRYYKLFYE